MDIIHEKEPRETVGRNTVSRFRMQFQAAAYAALEILSGKEIDRVYCDYHDDFVVRRVVADVIDYHFFQVKTKGKANQQWDVAEVFALKKTGALDTAEKLEAIRKSIAGKLFVHTIEFGDQCRGITVLSNVHFNDDVHGVVTDLSAGTSSKKYVRQFIEKFAEIVSPESPLSSEQVDAARKKLSLLANVQYIGDTLEAFGVAAHNAIWKHSEIELHRHEVGYLPLEAGAAHLLFELVNRRYERGSLLVTSNLTTSEWGSVFGDPVIATAILDRLLHHSHVITIRGDSYRLREKRRSGLLQKPAAAKSKPAAQAA